jgi:hypothetical protein
MDYERPFYQVRSANQRISPNDTQKTMPNPIALIIAPGNNLLLGGVSSESCFISWDVRIRCPLQQEVEWLE